MPVLVKSGEATAARRRVYFHLVDATDGITAETGEAGGQPEISTNGAAWTSAGIGTLEAIGNGRYYADLTQGAVLTAGDRIETRYKSVNTAETPGDSVHVVAFDPHDALDLGLAALTGHTPQTGDSYALLGAPAGASIAADIAAVPAALLDLADAIESVAPTLTLRQAMRVLVAAACGKSAGFTSSTGTATFKSPDGGKTRISAPYDADGNRTANPTLDVS